RRMLSYLNKLTGNRCSPSPARTGRRRLQGRARLQLERLEDRTVPTFIVQGHHLTVLADSPGDRFCSNAVPNAKPQVELNTNLFTGDMSAIDHIYFKGVPGGLNQAVLFDTTGYVKLNLTLFGDHGTMTGSNYKLFLSDIFYTNAVGAGSGLAS